MPVTPRRRKKGFTFFDALLCANGVAAAIYEADVFGARFPLLHVLFFAAMCIVAYCGVILLLTLVAEFPGHDRLTLLLLVGSNLLPTLVILAKHLGYLPLDPATLSSLFDWNR